METTSSDFSSHASGLNLQEFCKTSEVLLGLEKEAELEESRCLQEQIHPKLLEKRGVCLTKLVIESRKTSLYGRLVLTLVRSNVNRPELPSHSITTGDIVGLHANSQDGMIASGIVNKISSTQLSVAFDHNEELSNLGDDVQYYLVKLANDVTYKRLKRALNKLKQERGSPAERLIDVMFNGSSDSPPNQISMERIKLYNQNLDISQRQAVQLALSQKTFAIIHGPPGTGKSTTVIEVIQQFVGQGLKVLACAPSNVAVDNLVLRLADRKVRVTRLGHPARAMQKIQKYSLDAQVSASDENSLVEDIRKDIDNTLKSLRQNRGQSSRSGLYSELKSLRKELRQRSDAAVKKVLNSSHVILSTLTSATDDGPIRILDDMHFDVVVIDECSQALEVACWIALAQAPRCVLAGDHLQLPPTILSEKAAADGLAVTLMERLIPVYPDHVQMLTVQYRMNELIMNWSSEELYKGMLTADKSVANHLLTDLPSVKSNDLTQEPLMLIDTAGCELHELDISDEQSKGNEGEADLVAIYAESLVVSGINSKDIAVITPYNLQVELIRNRLSDKYRDLEIKSVDGYQGREKEAVIISLVRSNNKGVIGFLSERRRLNVAVTRARRHVAIIGDSQTVSHDQFLGRLVKYMNDHGVVRSAAEYQQEYSIGQLSDKVADMIRTKKDEEIKYKDKKKSKPKKKNDKPKSATVGNNTTAAPQSSVGKSSSNTNEKQLENREEIIRQEMTSLVVDFVNSDQDVLHCSISLTSYERMIVHQTAESYGLSHTSISLKNERQLVLKKSPEKTADDVEKNQEEDLENPGDEELATPTTSALCENCKREVPISNLSLHKLRCVLKEVDVPPDVRVKETSSSKQISNKKENSKSTKTNSKGKKEKTDKKTINTHDIFTRVDDDDFDALLAAANQLNSVCNFKKCKTLVKTLGVSCEFCKLRFCLEHGMPEAHGCGDAVRLQAWKSLSQGTNLSNRKSSSTRTNLERKLNKKLTDMTDKRKRKQEK